MVGKDGLFKPGRGRVCRVRKTEGELQTGQGHELQSEYKLMALIIYHGETYTSITLVVKIFLKSEVLLL